MAAALAAEKAVPLTYFFNTHRDVYTNYRTGRFERAGWVWLRVPEMTGLIGMVGTARFELATPCTPSKCATRLRYVPMESAVEDDSVGVDFQILHQAAAEKV